VLDDGDESLRYIATLSLGQGGTDAVPYLIVALSNSAPRIIEAAAESLGKIGHDAGAALPRLNELLRTAVPGAAIYTGKTETGEIKIVTLSEDEAAKLHRAVETAIEGISKK